MTGGGALAVKSWVKEALFDCGSFGKKRAGDIVPHTCVPFHFVLLLCIGIPPCAPVVCHCALCVLVCHRVLSYSFDNWPVWEKRERGVRLFLIKLTVRCRYSIHRRHQVGPFATVGVLIYLLVWIEYECVTLLHIEINIVFTTFNK